MILGIIVFIFTLYLVTYFSLKKILILTSILLSSIFLFLLSDNQARERVFQTTFKQFTDQETKQIIFPKRYANFYITSYKMFLTKPIFGHGPKSYRKVCKEKEFNLIENHASGEDNCSTSPHNIYFQLMGETGLLGIVPVIFLFLYVSIDIIKVLINFYKKL